MDIDIAAGNPEAKMKCRTSPDNNKMIKKEKTACTLENAMIEYRSCVMKNPGYMPVLIYKNICKEVKKMRNGINIDLTKEIACTKNIICTTVLHEYSLAKPRHNLSVYCQRIVPKLKHLEDILRDTNRSIDDMYSPSSFSGFVSSIRRLQSPPNFLAIPKLMTRALQ